MPLGHLNVRSVAWGSLLVDGGTESAVGGVTLTLDVRTLAVLRNGNVTLHWFSYWVWVVGSVAGSVVITSDVGAVLLVVASEKVTTPGIDVNGFDFTITNRTPTRRIHLLGLLMAESGLGHIYLPGALVP